MLGISWPELMVVAVFTVLVLGPKELPRVLRTVTRVVRKIRNLSAEFQSTLNDMAREADLEDLKKNFAEVESRVADMRIEDELDSTLDGDNKIAAMFTGDAIGTELAAESRREKPVDDDDDGPADNAKDDDDKSAANAAAAKKTLQQINDEADADLEPDISGRRRVPATESEDSTKPKDSEESKESKESDAPEDGSEKPVAKVAAAHSADS